jgi:hypothetical protein
MHYKKNIALYIIWKEERAKNAHKPISVLLHDVTKFLVLSRVLWAFDIPRLSQFFTLLHIVCFCIAKCREIASKRKYHYSMGPENIISGERSIHVCMFGVPL